MSTLEELMTAGQVLTSCSDSATVRRATQLLQTAPEQPEVWELCLSLLQPEVSADLSFLCAVLLYEKTKKEVNSMSTAQRETLRAYLTANLAANFPPATCRKLCQIFAFITLALSAPFLESLGQFPLPIALEILSSVPSLLSEFHFSDNSKRIFANEVKSHSSKLASFLLEAVRQPNLCTCAADVIKDLSEMQFAVLQNCALVQALLR